MPLRLPVPLSVVSLSVAASLLAAGLPLGAPPAAAAGTERETVIIELDGKPALKRIGEETATELRRGSAPSADRTKYRALAKEITGDQNAVVAGARSRGLTVDKPRHLTATVNAVVVTADPAQLAALRALPGVARVTVDTPFRALEEGAPKPTATATPKPSAAPTTSTPKSTPTPAPAAAPKDSARVLPGTGTTVAILDTGIDYLLPDLGAGFGEGFKVVDGYDFINDDSDPMDDHYHGTHVAGIVAGTGADSITGEAPGALLTAYKVLDSFGSGELSGILRALDAAVDPLGAHPADIVNMSLGGDGDGSDLLSVAADNATRSGTLVVAAAGNSGPGEATIGSPGAASLVLAVGASITNHRIPAATLVTPARRPITATRAPFSATAPATDVTAQVIDVGTGEESDFTKAGNVKGKIVAYQGAAPSYDGGLSLSIAQRAERHGAVAAFVYTNSALSQGGGYVPEARVQAPGIAEVSATGPGTLASGDDNRLDHMVVFELAASEYALFSAAAAAGTATATITSTDVNDEIASFSSRGPTLYGALKPEVVAPGFDIPSTVPRHQEIPGNVYRLSGTSMAAPYVAGTAAVMAALRPELDSVTLRELVIGGAVPLDSKARDASPSVQGAGRVKTDRAADASVFASPATLGFGQADADKPRALLDFTLTNTSAAPVTAQLTVRPSASSRGTLTLSKDRIVIPAGASVTGTAAATAAITEAETELSGEIEVALSAGPAVRIPYLQLSRHLQVAATPAPSTGLATIEVTSLLPLDTAPTLKITPQHGRSYTVQTKASASLPGYYEAQVAEKKTGVYRVSATSATGSKTIRGTGSFEVVASATSSKTWQQLGRNGNSLQLAVSPARPGTAMQTAGTSARPFVTTDYGKTWTHIQSIPVADGDGTLVADPKNGKAFWYFINASAGTTILDPSYTAKLLRTENLGKTWTTQPLPNKTVRNVATAGNGLVAVTADGAEVSTNGGKSWKHLAFDWSTKYITSSTIFRGDLYVTSVNTMWRVESVFSKPGAPTVVQTTKMSYSSISSGPSFIAVGGEGGTSISKNGDDWTKTAFDPDAATVGLTVLGDRILASGLLGGYHQSTDLGATWTTHPFPVRSGLAESFTQWPGKAKSLLIPMPLAGLYSSADDGASFTRIAAPATSIRALLATTNTKGDATVIAADELGIGSTPLPTTAELADDAAEWGASGTEAWVNVGSSDLEQDAVDKGTLWRTQFSFGSTGIRATTDEGKSWSGVGPYTQDVFDIEASPKVSGHVVASASSGGRSRELLVTHDGWAHWQAYSHPITIRRVTIDPHVDSRLWLAADDGLYRSNDDGRTITKVADGEMDAAWVDPKNPSHVVAAGRGLWVSHNGGASFTVADAGGADMYISSITSSTVRGKNNSKKTILFAGSTTFRPGHLLKEGRGVLASIDNGDSWHNVSVGIGTTAVLSLATSADGKWLLAGTRQGGIYRASVAELADLLK